MSWPASGRVNDGRFSRVFGSLVTGHLTGVLRLEVPGEDGQHVLFWEDGAIVDADCRAAEDTLGRVALEAALIDNATLGEAIRRQAASPGRSQKQILEEMGVLSGEGMDRATRLALTRRALRIFALPHATFTVVEEEHGRSEGGPVEPRWTLYRGLRLNLDERRLDRELQDLADQALKLATDPATLVELFGFSDEEHILLAYLEKGYWELEDLVEACLTMPRVVVLAAVAALRAVAALDVQPAASVPRLRKRAREATLQMGKDQIKPRPQGMGVHFSSQQTQVTAATRASRPESPIAGPNPSGTQPPVGARPSTQPPVGARPLTPPPTGSRPLTPPPAATPPPLLTQPWTASTKPPAPSMSQPPGLSRTTTQQAVAARPVSANMGSVSAPAVTKGIREQIASKLAQIEGGADHFKVLEVERNATSIQIKTAYFHLAKTYHPDRLALVQLEALRPKVERIFARLSDAYAGIVDEPRRRAYLDILAQGGEAAVKRKANDEADVATKLLTAEEHFRKGEMALRRQLIPTAIEEFKAALDLNDAESEHHALYAWAKWLGASDKDAIFPEVKKGLNKAVELSDRCLPAFLYLAQIYSARNELEKAYHMFQRVLALNEHHVDAKREVRVIEMRRAKGTDKRSGIFDIFKKK